MIIKKLFQIITMLSCIYFAPASLAQYKMPEGLPICKDIDLIENDLPELPTDDYPAKHYTNAQFIEKIVALANNSLINPKELETEFGLKFYECAWIPVFKKDEKPRPIHMLYSKGPYPLSGKASQNFSDNATLLKNNSSNTVRYMIFENNRRVISFNFDQKNEAKNVIKSTDCDYRKQIVETLGIDWKISGKEFPYFVTNYIKKDNFYFYDLFITHEHAELPYCKNKIGINYMRLRFSPR